MLRCLFCFNIFLLYFIGFAQSQERELVLTGKVNLLEITNGSDTLYLTESESVIEIRTTQFQNGNIIEERLYEGSISDNIHHQIPYNVSSKICFSQEGYQTKCLNVNTHNILKSSSSYEYGFEFPYRVNLIKGENNNQIDVGEVYYNPVSDYFEVR